MVEFRFAPYSDAQREFVDSEDKVVAYIGGLGSGKTHVGAVWAVKMMLKYPHAQGLIAANSIQQLETATLSKLFSLLDEFRIKYAYNKVTKVLRLQIPGFTGEVHCRTLAEYQQLRGTEYLWSWLDETRDTKKDAFDVVLGRLRQRIDRQTGRPIPTEIPPDAELDLAPHMLRITTTPDMLRGKWLYDYLNDPRLKVELAAKGIRIKELHASSYDNPYLPTGYVETLASSYDEELRRQEIEGEWIIIPPGKPVFGSVFNAKAHLDDLKFNTDKPLLIGIDWGFHHPAAIFAQEDSRDRLLVLGELLETDKETGEFMEAIWSYVNKRFSVGKRDVKIEAFCDPAGKQRTSKSRKSDIEIAREYGIFPIYKRVEILDGLRTIRRRMNTLISGQPALLVDKNHCPKLVEGFRGGYHYPEQRNEFTEEKETPFKDGVYDHLFDALRYICVNKYLIDTDKRRFGRQPNNQIIDPDTGY